MDVNELTVGDRVENPSQRSGKTFEVVDIREEQTFDGEETVFAVERVDHSDATSVRPDVIYEKDHDRWEVVEE